MNNGDVFRGAVGLFRARSVLILACAVVAAGAAVAAALSRSEEYQTAASLYFRPTSANTGVSGAEELFATPQDPVRQASTNVELVRQPRIAALVKRALDVPLAVDALLDAVEVTQEGESDIVSVRATWPDPRAAARIANAWASEFVAFRRAADRARIAQAIRLVDAQLGQLPPESPRARTLRPLAEQLRVAESLQTGDVEFLQSAQVPLEPVGPGALPSGLVAGALGLLLGFGAAAVRERTDRRVKTGPAASEIAELPLISEIPQVRSAERPLLFDDHALLEAFRTLANKLTFFNVDRSIDVAMVTSAREDEGKSTVASNLAFAAALAGRRTILVEADLRRGALATRLGVSHVTGLSDVLSGQADINDAIVDVSLNDPRLGELSSSVVGEAAHDVALLLKGPTPPNPVQMLASDRARSLVDDLRSAYDFVVIDTPPILRVSDALPLLSRVDGYLMVCRINYSTTDDLGRARDALGDTLTNALGIVANGVQPRASGYYYGYTAADPASAPSAH